MSHTAACQVAGIAAHLVDDEQGIPIDANVRRKHWQTAGQAASPSTCRARTGWADRRSTFVAVVQFLIRQATSCRPASLGRTICPRTIDVRFDPFAARPWQSWGHLVLNSRHSHVAAARSHRAGCADHRGRQGRQLHARGERHQRLVRERRPDRALPQQPQSEELAAGRDAGHDEDASQLGPGRAPGAPVGELSRGPGLSSPRLQLRRRRARLPSPARTPASSRGRRESGSANLADRLPSARSRRRVRGAAASPVA